MIMLWVFWRTSRYFASLSLSASEIFRFSDILRYNERSTLADIVGIHHHDPAAGRQVIRNLFFWSLHSASPNPFSLRIICSSRVNRFEIFRCFENFLQFFIEKGGYIIPSISAKPGFIHAMIPLRTWNIPSGVAERMSVSCSFCSFISPFRLPAQAWSV